MKKVDSVDSDVKTDWHDTSTSHALKNLETSANGLSQRDAQKRLLKNGPNSLAEAERSNPLMRFLLHFHNILIYVLLGSAAVTAMLAHWIDTSVILLVVFANATIGYIQEGKAEKAMNAIRHMLAPTANVIRDGSRTNIMSEHLVPGDIVLLEAGDKVPADLRLLTTHGIAIQEAILTGESVPVEKQTDPVTKDAALGDRSCMAFTGTLVTSGQGIGLVVATGGNTEIGRISGLLSEVETLTTPLVAQMNIFAKWLTLFILVLAALLLAYGYFIIQHDFADIFMIVVGLSVAAIPEGLPAVMTITLAIGVQAMARRNAIVRHLPAIETLGSISVICSDKTGTLTRNEMMVASILTHQDLFSLDGNGYEPEGVLKLGESVVEPSELSILGELARAATLCNDAVLDEQKGVWAVEGDPMEGALLAFAGKMGLNFHKEQTIWQRIDTIPFDAKHRFMATLNHGHEQHALILVKGAPEQILAMCVSQLTIDGQSATLDLSYWREKSEFIAALGQRVLAFALKPVKTKHTVLERSDIENSLIIIGMVGMIDPPRPEAIKAIAECHSAGIQVKMITGDHAKTAAAIGKQIGLNNPVDVKTGSDLDNMTDSKLRQTVLNCDIFARTSPEHKLRLVTALQSHNMTVAMTGDGVNDAPALKRADAGIAMGRNGSEAAKEAADLVLADDNFSSIVAAVREGRTVYDNLKKVISFLLPVNGGESISLIIAILLGLTLPITPVQILWVNMVSSVALAMALAFEPSEPRVMQRPPRLMHAPILSGFLLWRIAFVSLLFSGGIFGQFFLTQAQGINLDTARTMTVNTLVVMEIFYLFSVRYIHGSSLTLRAVLGTKAVISAVSIVTLLQFLFTYSPFLQTFFATQPLTMTQNMQVIAFGVVILLLLETEKYVYNRWGKTLSTH